MCQRNDLVATRNEWMTSGGAAWRPLCALVVMMMNWLVAVVHQSITANTATTSSSSSSGRVAVSRRCRDKHRGGRTRTDRSCQQRARHTGTLTLHRLLGGAAGEMTPASLTASSSLPASATDVYNIPRHQTSSLTPGITRSFYLFY